MSGEDNLLKFYALLALLVPLLLSTEGRLELVIFAYKLPMNAITVKSAKRESFYLADVGQKNRRKEKVVAVVLGEVLIITSKHQEG